MRFSNEGSPHANKVADVEPRRNPAGHLHRDGIWVTWLPPSACRGDNPDPEFLERLVARELLARRARERRAVGTESGPEGSGAAAASEQQLAVQPTGTEAPWQRL